MQKPTQNKQCIVPTIACMAIFIQLFFLWTYPGYSHFFIIFYWNVYFNVFFQWDKFFFLNTDVSKQQHVSRLLTTAAHPRSTHQSWTCPQGWWWPCPGSRSLSSGGQTWQTWGEDLFIFLIKKKNFIAILFFIYFFKLI